MRKSASWMVLLSLALQPAVAKDAKPETKEKLAATHPDYVRCRRIEETGSLVKKHKVCKTNAEWARLREQGNNAASDLVENQRRGFTNEQ